MAEHDSTRNPDHRNHLTRRGALREATPAIAAVAALPAVVLAEHAAAAAPGDDDPGLPLIETGYRQWQELRARADALSDLQKQVFDRAKATLPEPEPEPVVPDEIKPLLAMVSGGTIDDARDPASPISIPQHLLDKVDAYFEERHRWRERQPTLDGNPDYEQSLAIPTRSPRGLVIKMAIGVELRPWMVSELRSRSVIGPQRTSCRRSWSICRRWRGGLARRAEPWARSSLAIATALSISCTSPTTGPV